MKRVSKFPTAIQNIALNLIFAVMGESRFNRTPDEYRAIIAALPPLKVLTSKINRLLRQAHQSNNECNGFVLPQLCRFKGEKGQALLGHRLPTLACLTGQFDSRSEWE
jgi:hypothetical protein